MFPHTTQVEEFAGSFLAANPRLDVLVNNAGGMPATRTLSAQGREAIMVRSLHTFLEMPGYRSTSFYFDEFLRLHGPLFHCFTPVQGFEA